MPEPQPLDASPTPNPASAVSGAVYPPNRIWILLSVSKRPETSHGRPRAAHSHPASAVHARVYVSRLFQAPHSRIAQINRRLLYHLELV